MKPQFHDVELSHDDVKVESDAMRILIVNVNTTTAVTDGIVTAAQEVAEPNTEIIGLTPTIGADSVEGNFESYLAAVAVMNEVLQYDGPFDAVVQAGFGEHGKEGLQELLDVPVIDITEAAAHVAYMLGWRYSVVTTLQRTVPLIEDRLLTAGLMARCASIRSTGLGVLELEDVRIAQEAIEREARVAIERENADVIVLGCGGMAGLDSQLEKKLGVPVVDGVKAGIKLAESLVSLELSTSKLLTYAPPRVKVVSGWPLRAQS